MTTELHAVCSVGYPGAGKSVAEHVARDMGIPTVQMGDRLRERAVKEHGNGILKDSSRVGEFATRQREKHGQGVVAEWTVKYLENTDIDTEVVFIDGVRSEAELEIFAEFFTRFTVVFISAPLDIRVRRIQNRERSSDEQDATIASIRERDAREGRWGLDEFIQDGQYDVRIENTGSLSEFQGAVKQLLNDVE